MRFFKFKRLKIVEQIGIVFFSAVLIPMSVFGFIINNVNQQSMRYQLRESAVLITNMVSDEIDFFVDNVSGMLEHLAFSLKYMQNDAIRSKYLIEVQEQIENCEEIVIRTTEWKGLVALMYPTDWSYASSNPECKSDIWYGAHTSYNLTNGGVCTKNNWVSTDYDGEHTNAFEFLTSMDNFLGEGSALFMGGGGLNLNFRVSTPAMYVDSYSVKPSLYLKSNVKIISGNGSRDNPYKLGI